MALSYLLQTPRQKTALEMQQERSIERWAGMFARHGGCPGVVGLLVGRGHFLDSKALQNPHALGMARNPCLAPAKQGWERGFFPPL